MGIVFTCYLGRYCQIEILKKGNLKLNKYIHMDRFLWIIEFKICKVHYILVLNVHI